MQEYTEPFGTIQNHTGLFGTTQDKIGQNGTTLNRTLQDHLRPYGTKQDHLATTKGHRTLHQRAVQNEPIKQLQSPVMSDIKGQYIKE